MSKKSTAKNQAFLVSPCLLQFLRPAHMLDADQLLVWCKGRLGTAAQSLGKLYFTVLASNHNALQGAHGKARANT